MICLIASVLMSYPTYTSPLLKTEHSKLNLIPSGCAHLLLHPSELGNYTQSRQITRLFLQSSELGPPRPHPQASVSPPLVSGGTHSLAGEGWGEGPNSDEGTDTVVLYRYKCTLWSHI
jgi:hypothetical protein